MKGVSFFVSRCALTEGTKTINIVRNNCYAKELGGSLIGSHLQTRLAMFVYKSFTFDATKTQEQELRCEIMVCVDRQPCGINNSENSCPAYGIDGLFKFSLTGVPNEYPDVPSENRE